LSSLITNMLKLNKLEKQTISPMPEQYDLCSQLCDCALQFETVWENKDIEFEADIEERILIEHDEGLLELVWTNLLSNAMKFTPPGGRVILSETSDENEVTVLISDTGCGMDEETQRRIFDKFYQGDTSHSTEGNGLGLALVKRILQLSDGSISVESRVGEGTVFTVKLPLSLMNKENL
ncbi:MAG: sensor histidine kinase, partial [Coprococcus sp.]